MARCYPDPSSTASSSNAERKLFDALDRQLGPEFTVLHSVAWLSRKGPNGAREGEADFLIAHAELGLLVIEVKGGRISLDYASRQWTSTDQNGKTHDIKNPFEQGRTAKFAILGKLKEHPEWKKLRVGRFDLGYATFVPDVGDGHRLSGPDAPTELIGDRGDLMDIPSWIALAFAYWNGIESGNRSIGKAGVDAIVAIFARTVTVRPLLSARIHDEESERLSLTNGQMSILDVLRRQRRVMIAGGAGTGKTVIAREKAVRMASEGMRTLLLCYNRGLADHLREQCKGIERLDVATFHQVCSRWIDRVKSQTGRNLLAEARRDIPDGEDFDQRLPMALANAVDLLGPKYDVIVVDEAQDFGDEYWLPVEMLLLHQDGGMLYVFLDENQDIYRRSANIPVTGEPMMLDRNCRNTDAIHAAAYRHYKGPVVGGSQIEGAKVERVEAASIVKQVQAIGTLLTKLISQDEVAGHDIAVLLCSSRDKAERERALAKLPLPSSIKLGRIEDYGPQSLTVDSVARFKGLERSIIILWAFDESAIDEDRGTLYVGMSRAKSVLYVCGTVQACNRILTGDQDEAAN